MDNIRSLCLTRPTSFSVVGFGLGGGQDLEWGDLEFGTWRYKSLTTDHCTWMAERIFSFKFHIKFVRLFELRAYLKYITKTRL